MEKDNPEIAVKTEESFATKSKDIVFLFRSFLELSNGRLEEMKKTFYAKQYQPIWKKFLDLRILGLFFIITAFVFKVIQIRGGYKLFDACEFITVFIIGTILIILGTYFNIKEIQEDRKLIAEENKTITNTITAVTGLMEQRA